MAILDYEALYEAVEAVRRVRGHSQNRAAAVAGVPSSTFTRLRKGKGMSLDAYFALMAYLKRPAPFVRASD